MSTSAIRPHVVLDKPVTTAADPTNATVNRDIGTLVQDALMSMNVRLTAEHATVDVATATAATHVLVGRILTRLVTDTASRLNVASSKTWLVTIGDGTLAFQRNDTKLKLKSSLSQATGDVTVVVVIPDVLLTDDTEGILKTLPQLI